MISFEDFVVFGDTFENKQLTNEQKLRNLESLEIAQDRLHRELIFSNWLDSKITNEQFLTECLKIKKSYKENFFNDVNNYFEEHA